MSKFLPIWFPNLPDLDIALVGVQGTEQKEEDRDAL
jgi:hypothetical protein